MVLKIHTNAIKILREMQNLSFVIIELSNGAIVDFAETFNEGGAKCQMTDSVGSKCMFYETSLDTIENIRVRKMLM